MELAAGPIVMPVTMSEDRAIRVSAQRTHTAREGKHAVQMLALNPVLEFSRAIAGVAADFKRGDDDHFHRHRSLHGRLSERDPAAETGHRHDERSESTHA